MAPVAASGRQPAKVTQSIEVCMLINYGVMAVNKKRSHLRLLRVLSQGGQACVVSKSVLSRLRRNYFGSLRDLFVPKV